MIIIRVALALFASVVLAAGTQPAAAEIYRPWCVQYGGNDGDNGTTCAFTSFEQCMMTARGGAALACRTRGIRRTGAVRKVPWALAKATGPGGGEIKRARSGVRPGRIPADEELLGLRRVTSEWAVY